MIKITQKLDGRQVEEGHIQILNTEDGMFQFSVYWLKQIHRENISPKAFSSFWYVPIKHKDPRKLLNYHSQVMSLFHNNHQKKKKERIGYLAHSSLVSDPNLQSLCT